jgi:hypothetical protein
LGFQAASAGGGVAMELFTPRPNMLSELDKLERLMPEQKKLLQNLSKIIRNCIWGNVNEHMLAVYLNKVNWVFTIVIDTLGQSFHWADMYIDLLCKHSYLFTKYDISSKFVGIKNELDILNTIELIQEHWKQLNPLFSDEYADDDVKFKTGILELFDQVYQNSIVPYPNEFIVELGSVGHVCRGRKGSFTSINEILPPPIGRGGINRWNPPNKRCAYLAVSRDNSRFDEYFTIAEKTCCEEIRAKNSEIVTFADFTVSKSSETHRILNLDYDNISAADIKKSLDDKRKQYLYAIVSDMLSTGILPVENNIRKIIDMKDTVIQEAANNYCVKMLLKMFCDGIFIPIVDEQIKTKPKYKEMCYTSCHLFAAFLADRGFAGVLYPSTRMQCINKKGTNLVLFDPNDVEPDATSLRVKTYFD